MKCVCGSIIPDEAIQYPIKPQKVVKIDDRGHEVRTWETHVVKCEVIGIKGVFHPPSTGWNYVEQAHARHGEPYRKKPKYDSSG